MNPYEEFYLSTDEWKRTSADAKRRANYKCERCGNRSNLQTHHKNYDHLGDERPEDLQVLCNGCHEEVTALLAAGGEPLEVPVGMVNVATYLKLGFMADNSRPCGLVASYQTTSRMQEPKPFSMGLVGRMAWMLGLTEDANHRGKIGAPMPATYILSCMKDGPTVKARDFFPDMSAMNAVMDAWGRR